MKRRLALILTLCLIALCTPACAATTPPPLGEEYPSLTDSSTVMDNGMNALVYKGCSDTAEVLKTIEAYIKTLKSYGYTLTDSTTTKSSYHTYFLNGPDTSAETMTFRDHTCQLALEGFADDKYGWASIYVIYTPEQEAAFGLSESTASGGGSSSGSSSLGGSSRSSSSSATRTKRCTKCGGDGKVNCSRCNGSGGKYVYGSTPNYSGKSKTTTRTWENCSKCRGSGTQDCSVCGGDGKVEY